MSRRAEHLFSIIGQVDDAFIDEAACPRRWERQLSSAPLHRGQQRRRRS